MNANMLTPSNFQQVANRRTCVISRDSIGSSYTAPASGPTVWYFNHEAIKERLKAIRNEFPELGVGGWMDWEATAKAARNHRDPFMTNRFIEAVARAITYIDRCCAIPGQGRPALCSDLHRALAKRLGSHVPVGALISAYLALGGAPQDIEQGRSFLALKPRATQNRLPVSVVLRSRH